MYLRHGIPRCVGRVCARVMPALAPCTPPRTPTPHSARRRLSRSSVITTINNHHNNFCNCNTPILSTLLNSRGLPRSPPTLLRSFRSPQLASRWRQHKPPLAICLTLPDVPRSCDAGPKPTSAISHAQTRAHSNRLSLLSILPSLHLLLLIPNTAMPFLDKASSVWTFVVSPTLPTPFNYVRPPTNPKTLTPGPISLPPPGDLDSHAFRALHRPRARRLWCVPASSAH